MAIKACECQNQYQDQKYGKGQRVKNPSRIGKAQPAWTCTICGQKEAAR